MAPQLHPDRYRTRASILVLVVVATLTSQQLGGVDALSLDHYRRSCPRAEAAVRAAVRQVMARDRTVPAGLLRLHFHDCFVRGCDASVLLDSTPRNTAEKDGPPNASLHAFYVVHNAKRALEELCPGVVSCADVLALAARDAVALSGGPTWPLPLGRRDHGRAAGARGRLRPAEAGVPRAGHVRQGPGGALRRPHAGVRALLLVPGPHPRLPGRGPGAEPALRGGAARGVPGQQHGEGRRGLDGPHAGGLRQGLLPDAAERARAAGLGRGAADAPQDAAVRGAVRGVAGRLLQGLRQLHAQDERAQPARR